MGGRIEVVELDWSEYFHACRRFRGMGYEQVICWARIRVGVRSIRIEDVKRGVIFDTLRFLDCEVEVLCCVLFPQRGRVSSKSWTVMSRMQRCFVTGECEDLIAWAWNVDNPLIDSLHRVWTSTGNSWFRSKRVSKDERRKLDGRRVAYLSVDDCQRYAQMWASSFLHVAQTKLLARDLFTKFKLPTVSFRSFEEHIVLTTLG